MAQSSKARPQTFYPDFRSPNLCGAAGGLRRRGSPAPGCAAGAGGVFPGGYPGRAFALQQKLVRVLALDQPSVQAEADAALALFGDGPQAAERYRQAAAAFAVHYPKWELWFEQMLVNQVLFEGFPYSDRRQRPAAAYSALCAAYALVRFLAVGCTVQRHDVTQLVDVCAAAFRFIAHTAFSWNAPIVLGPDGMPPALWVLVQN